MSITVRAELGISSRLTWPEQFDLTEYVVAALEPNADYL